VIYDARPPADPVTAPTRKLHEELIRLAKSIIAVWEIWLKEQK
jgi:hypothetical protein